MKISDKKYYPVYQKEIEEQLKKDYAAYNFITFTKYDGTTFSSDFIREEATAFNYKTTVSGIFSCNMEGNKISSVRDYIDMLSSIEREKDIEAIEHLLKAFYFAYDKPLNKDNLLHAHEILSKSDTYRNQNRVGVAEPELIEEEMNVLFAEIAQLLVTPLSLTETFYFASLIHLRFMHIYPFTDGNGKTARLLEKWFMAASLGNHMWQIGPEVYYKEHQTQYYDNINLGGNFHELDYDKSLPFLYMLPQALR